MVEHDSRRVQRDVGPVPAARHAADGADLHAIQVQVLGELQDLRSAESLDAWPVARFSVFPAGAGGRKKARAEAWHHVGRAHYHAAGGGAEAKDSTALRLVSTCWLPCFLQVLFVHMLTTTLSDLSAGLAAACCSGFTSVVSAELTASRWTRRGDHAGGGGGSSQLCTSCPCIATTCGKNC